MCTLTYLPISEKEFIITSNRDESPVRKPASLPNSEDIVGKQVLYPKDGKAGGTWIAIADTRRLACLLNGAFEAHEHNPPYKRSRGLVVLDSFTYESNEEFFEEYDLEAIEPFTFVSFEYKNGLQIKEMRWDGKEKHIASFDASKPHIWSSASLYTDDTIEKRKKWFDDWLSENKKFHQKNILKFHHFGGEGDVYNDIRMNRDEMVKTVSVTSIKVENDKARVLYEDLLTESTSEKDLKLLN